MRAIDFISVSPFLTIFRKESNQTLFGGILFLIYLIIFVLLAVVYLYDFFSKDDYIFDYTLVKEDLNSNKIKENEKMNSSLHSDFNFSISLSKDDIDKDTHLDLSNNDHFLVVDIKKLNEKVDWIQGNFIRIDDDVILKRNEYYIRNSENFALSVLYRCEGSDENSCNIREEDRIIFDSYYLHFKYKGYNIEHQNQTKPLNDMELITHVQFLANTNIVYFRWKLIEYEEKKGVFGKLFDKITGKDNIYYGRYLYSTITYTDDGHMKKLPSDVWHIKDSEGNHFIQLLYLHNYFEEQEYDSYSRSANSALDSLANAFALSSTAKTVITLAYAILFAKNYDNYKIVENILNEKLKVNTNKRIKDIKDIKEKELEAKIELKADLIENSSEKNKIEDDKNIEDVERNKTTSYSDVDIDSPTFFDFLINKLYFHRCCGNSSKQNLINSCNEVVAKYISIEKILYNQMKLENLWKDYKWNNPKYESKEKEDLLLELKEK